jgi:hypothetical protein
MISFSALNLSLAILLRGGFAMSNKYAHLRQRAVELRTERQMSLDEIVERLQLPKTTIYYWIKDIPIP